MSRMSLGLALSFGILALGACAPTNVSTSPKPVEVRGVIQDRDGVGVAGVNVFLDPADDRDQIGTSAITGDNGEYRLRVKSGRYKWTLFAHDLRVPDLFGDTIELSPPAARLNYRYGGFKVEGRIVGPNGAPLKAGIVAAIGTGSQGYMIFPKGAIENGRYRMFLPASRYFLRAEPEPDFYPRTEIRGYVRISADTTIDFSATGHLVTGRVITRGFGAVRGVRVGAYGIAGGLTISAHDVTRADGRFRLYLPSGEFGIGVSPSRGTSYFEHQSFHYTVDSPRTIALELGEAVWRGTVRDSTTRLPIRFTNVIARQGRKLMATTLICKSDGLGHFLFAVRRGRKYALSVDQGKSEIGRTVVMEVEAQNDSTFDLFVPRSRGLDASRR